MNWREFPFLKIFPAFFLGILAADRVFPSGCTTELLFTLLLSAVGGAFVSGGGPFARRNPRVFYIWAILGFFMLGSWRYKHLQSEPDAGYFNKLADKPTTVLALAEEVRKGKKVLAVTARARAMVDTTGRTVPLQGKLMLFLEPAKDEIPIAGNLLRISGRIERIKDNPNPGAFNYAAYLRGKRVGFSMYANTGDWEIYRKSGAKGPENLLFTYRRICLEKLKVALPGAAEYAIGAALLLGNREEMDAGVRNIFSSTGAMHILAVSGLHVGMVAWFLGWLFGWVPRRGRWFKGIMEVIGIWIYALLCGLGASVVRAAFMFSWLNLGRALDRPANIWNTLSGTAFLLLLYEPLWMFDIGFQLSFLAVAGILLFEPPIYRILVFQNRVADYFWKLTAVGIAAQLATAPLGIFYFHQFPLLFLLSGWIAVPLGAICQAVGALYLFLAGLPLLGSLLGWSLQVLIKGLYWGIFILDQIPGSCIEGLWLSHWGTWCAYLLLGVGAWAFFIPDKKAVWLCTLLFFVASILELRRDWLSLRREVAWCYGIKGAAALEFWQGRRLKGFYAGDENRIVNQTEVLHLRHQTRERYQYSVFDTIRHVDGVFMNIGPLVVFGNQRFFIWDGRLNTFRRMPPKDADYWVLCNNPFLPEVIPRGRLPKKAVIVDGSNSAKSIRFYKSYFEKQDIPVHFTMEAGAWQTLLNPEKHERQRSTFLQFFER